MAERVPLRASVFAKLLAIMLTMAISLLLLVSWFFIVALLPILNSSVEPFVADYVRTVAATQPNLEAAKRLADVSDLEVRYEGPAGTWSTSEHMPPIAEVSPERGHLLLGGRGYHIVPAPDGGTYLFAWTFRSRTIDAHNRLLVLLLVLMIGTIVVTYMVIRRMLRPLRSLGDGVARLSAGQLDVVLSSPTRDEFGQLTNAFNEMVGRVRDMIRARDQLLLDVSHELRSPLTRMRVAIELLPEDRRRANMIADVAEMEAMIAELLELERLRDGRGIRSERTDLASLVREVAASFEEKEPGVRIGSMPREIPIEIDREKIRIVLRNLLENAIKYSLPDSDAVEISVACDDERAIVRVIDDGPGVPEEDLATLFEPFFRVNRSRVKAPAGYGLGLSICKRIVDAHGGTIAVQNNEGRGATFTMILRGTPASSPAGPQASRACGPVRRFSRDD